MATTRPSSGGRHEPGTGPILATIMQLGQTFSKETSKLGKEGKLEAGKLAGGKEGQKKSGKGETLWRQPRKRKRK